MNISNEMYNDVTVSRSSRGGEAMSAREKNEMLSLALIAPTFGACALLSVLRASSVYGVNSTTKLNY